MKSYTRHHILLALVLTLGIVSTASAQVLIKPTTATFTYPDLDLTEVTGFHFDVFACTTLVAGVCTPSATPTGTGVDVPVASVTGTAAARTFSLTAAAVQTFLATLPTTSAYISTLLAHGDPAQGFGDTGRSAASNPFVLQVRVPATPGAEILR